MRRRLMHGLEREWLQQCRRVLGFTESCLIWGLRLYSSLGELKPKEVSVRPILNELDTTVGTSFCSSKLSIANNSKLNIVKLGMFAIKKYIYIL